MPYFPKMAYRMVSLEPRLTPPTGLGDLPATAWCSPTNRQGSCNPITGVCLPMTSATLATFKDLQRQTNRILSRAGKSLIGVDGRIGPGTVNAVADAMSYVGALGLSGGALAMGLSWSTVRGKPCDLIAAHADQVASQLSTVANALAAPAVPDPGSSKPSQPSTGGGVSHPPPADIVASASGGLTMFNFLPVEVRVPAAIGLFVFAGLLLRKHMKPARAARAVRGRARARRPARRRRR